MPVKKYSSKKRSKKTSRVVSIKNIISYDSEYTVLKTFFEMEDYKGSISALKTFETKIKKTKTNKKTNMTLYDVLKFLTYSKFNKISESLSLLERIEKNANFGDLKESLMYIDIKIAKADIFWKIGKNNEALEILQKLEKEFSSKTLSNNVLERIGELFNLKGIFYWFNGEVNEAQNSFQHSLTVMGRIGNKTKFTAALNNLGNVSIYKGDLNVALDLHLQALEVRMKLGVKNHIASSLGNIAEIYHYKGEFEKSLENYLQAKELFEEIENVLYQAKVNYELMTLYLEYDKLEDAKNTLQTLDGLRKTSPSNDYIRILYYFSEGLLFKKSKRLLDKFHAAINFNSIVKDKVIDNEITVQAILNLTDILLLEIRLSNNERILDDIKNYCSEVHRIAQLQNSPVLIVQGYLLESKLDLLDFKYMEAKNILYSAVSI